jgi:acyl-CoA synthetase (AMP-forming)/AMP-acid ligase II
MNITSLNDIPFINAERNPANTALIDAGSGNRLTYEELAGSVSYAARLISKSGLHGGDRFGLIAKSSINYVITMFAALEAGCIVVPLNPSLDEKDLLYQCKDCGLSALYHDSYYEPKAGIIADGIPGLKASIYEKDLYGNISMEERLPGGEIYPDSPAAIVYTSGTTRLPLGATLSHKNLLSNNLSIAKYLSINADSTVLCVLPLYYIYGLSLIFSHFLEGGTVVLDNRFVYPNVILDSLKRFRIKGFAGVSSHYAILLDRSDIKNTELPDLEYLTQAGDSMPPAVTREIRELFPDKDLYIMYGQTEAAPRLTYLDPSRVDRKPSSIGQAVPGVEIRLINERGEECAKMEEGEITARGDNIMLGYWNRPEETRKVLRNGWLHTGDLAYRDEESDIFITGRARNFVNIGANRVNPLEIEHSVTTDERIMEAAAVPVSDPLLGHRIKLFISAKKEAIISAEDIRKLCKKVLPPYKIPSDIIIMDSLPKNRSGKIDKNKLKEEV